MVGSHGSLDIRAQVPLKSDPQPMRKPGLSINPQSPGTAFSCWDSESKVGCRMPTRGIKGDVEQEFHVSGFSIRRQVVRAGEMPSKLNSLKSQ